MLYGWIEVGASNENVFANETYQDIIIRTIYDNKVIIGNTNGTGAVAATYIQGNNVGIKKVPDNNVALDVNGFCVLRSAQVGLSNTPTSLTVNGDIIVKDKAKSFGTSMELSVLNNNNAAIITYNGVQRVKVTDGQGFEINDTLNVTNDVFATAFQITSDERFKFDINPTEPEKDLQVVKKIDVRDFKMKCCPEKVVKGFIAQELEQIFPQAIVPKRGFTEDGVLLNDIKTIDTNQILAINTSVIQQLLARVEALEKNLYADNKLDESGVHYSS